MFLNNSSLQRLLLALSIFSLAAIWLFVSSRVTVSTYNSIDKLFVKSDESLRYNDIAFLDKNSQAPNFTVEASPKDGDTKLLEEMSRELYYIPFLHPLREHDRVNFFDNIQTDWNLRSNDSTSRWIEVLLADNGLSLRRALPPLFINEIGINDKLSSYTIPGQEGDIFQVNNGSFMRIDETTLPLFFRSRLEGDIVKIMRESNSDILAQADFSFESFDTETARIDDCNNTAPGEPQFAVRNSTDANEGTLSLELESSNHIACLSLDFPVELAREAVYSFGIDYKTVSGQKAQYGVAWLDEDGQKIAESDVLMQLDNSNDQWQRSVIAIPVTPLDARSLRLTLYSVSISQGQTTINLYDNIQLSEHTEFFADNPELSKYFDELDVIESHELIRDDSEQQYRLVGRDDNLLAAQNSSFEDGFWQDEAEDCTIQRAGEPQFTHALLNQASDGSQSLRLGSSSHHACVSKDFSLQITPGFSYRLSFDYKTVKGGKAGIFYELATDSTAPTISAVKNLTSQSSQWQTFEAIVEPDFAGEATLKVFFYARSENNEEVETLYDNVRFTPTVPEFYPHYYLHARNNVGLRSPQSLNQTSFYALGLGTKEFTLTVPNDLLFITNSKPFRVGEQLSASFGNSQVSLAHFRTSVGNGWLINVPELCESYDCITNDSGTVVLNLQLDTQTRLLPLLAFVVSFIAALISAALYLRRRFKFYVKLKIADDTY